MSRLLPPLPHSLYFCMEHILGNAMTLRWSGGMGSENGELALIVPFLQ